MSLLALRVGDRRDAAALELAAAFLEACTTGELLRARAMTSPDFRWFLGPLSPAAGEGPAARGSFMGRRVEHLELLPRGLVALWNPDALSALVGVPVEAEDRLARVDVLRGERASLGLLLRAAPRATVVAVFDPLPLGRLLAETAARLAAMMERG